MVKLREGEEQKLAAVCQEPRKGGEKRGTFCLDGH